VRLTRTIDRSRQSFHIILLPRGYNIIITTISDLRVSLIAAGKLSRIPNNNIIKRPAARPPECEKLVREYEISVLADPRARLSRCKSVPIDVYNMYIRCHHTRTTTYGTHTHTRFVYKPLFRRKCFTRNFSKRKSAVYLRRRRMFIATIYRRKGFPRSNEPTNER